MYIYIYIAYQGYKPAIFGLKSHSIKSFYFATSIVMVCLSPVYCFWYIHSPSYAVRSGKTPVSFTFCGPCIVIYLRNKDQQDALFFLNLFQ